MFQKLTLHGARAALLWGSRPVAVLTSWRITKPEDNGPWHLAATCETVSAWQCRKAAEFRELIFTAPRVKGQWCWPLIDVTVGTRELRARLGPPLQ